MTAYLVANRPARSQFRAPRRARPTGLVVVHTAESILDKIGPDTGAENVARFIVGRTTPGSYHDLVDSDSGLQLVDYAAEAYQDGTGSNPFALSLSFALSAADWPKLTDQRRDAFLTQGARAFHRQQAWLRSKGYPLTPLRRVSRDQSQQGLPGFISHGERDPGRRTDPGRHFPWTRFFDLIVASSGHLPGVPATPPPAPPPEAPVFRLLQSVDPGRRMFAVSGARIIHLSGPQLSAFRAAGLLVNPDSPDDVNDAEVREIEQALA